MKKIKHLSVLLALMAIVLLSSCSASQAAYSDLRNYTNQLREYSQDYTLKDWKDAAIDFKDIASRVESYNYSAEKQREIRRMEGECAGYLLKGAGTSVIRSVLNISEEIKAGVDGFLDIILGKDR
ncbi:MAG: hypothetical protein IKX36_00065 [Prevotella sp.]|nr:hypothetical protein [Prevotella sp.]